MAWAPQLQLQLQQGRERNAPPPSGSAGSLPGPLLSLSFLAAAHACHQNAGGGKQEGERRVERESVGYI